MTPAALSFESCSPKAKFRGNQRRLIGAVQSTVSGIRKASKFRTEYKKTTHTSSIGAESCDEEEYLSKRQCSSVSNSTSCNPSTSGKCVGDSHIEASDEDGDNYSSCPEDTQKSEGGVQRINGLCKDGFPIKEESAETAFGDDYCLLGRRNARNFYLVKSDGRPAEMFRTDLFDKMRKGIDANIDSDDDDIPGNGLHRMIDKWRAEWSGGTQVPMGTICSDSSGVRKTVVKRSSSCNASIRDQRRKLMEKFFAEPFKSSVVSPLRLYECTALDKQWLKLMNEHYLRNGRPPLSMEVFLEIMNDFEIECYKNIHRKLLEPLNSPSSRVTEQDDEAACDICRICECEPDDEMVFCDGCNLCVHMSCYGLQELPPDEWLCMKCRLCFGRNPPCILCPTIGGALKCVDRSSQWAHVVCALWIHECRFGDFEKREPITSINEIKQERWTAKCAICDTRQGACIKCSVSTCKIWFHATCALRSGLEMRIEQNPNDDGVDMISLCPKHRFAKPYSKDENKCEADQTSSDEEADGLCSIGLLAKLEQTCYLYVSHEETATRLKQDPLVVADVFEFWKRKRLQLNNGRPLIDNLQDEIRIGDSDTVQLDLPECTTDASTVESPPAPIKRRRGRPRKYPLESMDKINSAPANVSVNGNMEETDIMCSRLLHSLKEGRKLLDLVVQRCQAERDLTLTRLRLMMTILDHTETSLPLSQRRLAFFSEILKESFSKSLLNEAGEEVEEVFPSGDSTIVTRSLHSRTNSGAQSCESSSTAPPQELIRRSPRLQCMHWPQENQEDNCDMLSVAKPSCHSRLNSLSLRKRSVKQRCYSSNQMKEQENARKRSLRSWNDKSLVKSEENTALEHTTRATHRKQTIKLMQSPVCTENVRFNSPRRSSVDGMSTNKEENSTEDVNHTLASAPKQSSVSSNNEKIPVLCQPDSGTRSEKLGSPLRKRCESVSETSSAEMRLLKSLDMRSFNKDSNHRMLRSRSSLPPMLQRDHVFDGPPPGSKNVIMARNRTKRKSDERDGNRRLKSQYIL